MTTLLGGKYVLDRRLGGGGMAEVFLARTVGKAGFERPVAIKCILPGYAERPQFVDMFVAEAQLTAKLRHPNIVSVLDFDQDDARRLFLVMELVEGTDLDGLLATGPLPYELVVFVIAEVVRGLGYAHALPLGADGVRGLVHRDVSPHNVLLSWAGEVKVSDFGIAKARAATDATASVLIKGKPAYMSPEQANGQPLDGASDLFAVGVMLWEMLSGQPLFATDTLESTLARVMFAPIVRPSTLRRDVPADLERVALRLLERDRKARYPDADAVLADLLACTHAPRDGREALAALLAARFPGRAPQRPSSVVRTGPEARTIAPSAITPRAAQSLPGPVDPTRPGGAGGRRRVWLGAVVGVALALGVGIALAVNVRGGDDPNATAPAAGGVTPAPTNARSADAGTPAPVPPATSPSTSSASAQEPPTTAPGETPADGARDDTTSAATNVDPAGAPVTSATGSGAARTIAPADRVPAGSAAPADDEPKTAPARRTHRGRSTAGASKSSSRIEEIKLGN